MTSSSSIATRKILIAEDEIISALSISESLNVWGYQVCGLASTGEEAVAIAETLNPDLILMDIRMATANDGITAAEAIRARRLGVPIIFITGYPEAESELRGKRLDPFDFMQKPVNFDQLKNKIESLLHNSNS